MENLNQKYIFFISNLNWKYRPFKVLSQIAKDLKDTNVLYNKIQKFDKKL